MICKECNANVPEGAVFCPNCGAMVDDIVELEGTTVLSDETTILDEDDEGTTVLKSNDESDLKDDYVDNSEMTANVENISKQGTINSAYENVGFDKPKATKNNKKIIIIVIFAVAVAVIAAVVAGIAIKNADTSSGSIDNDFESDSHIDLGDYVDDNDTFNDDEVNNELDENNQTSNVTITNIDNPGRIIIDEAKISDSGFYYENDNPNAPWIIEMGGTCIYGTFHYSEDLTETEKSEWCHGGYLLDENGDYCDFDVESAWSDYNALEFACELPSDIPSGKYTYVLSQCFASYTEDGVTYADGEEGAHVDFVVE